MKYQEAYRNVHPDLVSLLSTYFAEVQHGLQGDSWMNITVEQASVDVDTFTAMKHQIKSDKAGPHVDKVIQVLKLKYEVDVFEKPEFEPHEKS